MAEYTITISRDGKPIYDQETDADTIIEFMRALMVTEDDDDSDDDDNEREPGRHSKSKTRKPRACSLCNKTGHTRATCPTERDAEPPPSLPLEEDEFISVKEMQSEGSNALEISKVSELPMREINIAIRCSTYDGYLFAHNNPGE